MTMTATNGRNSMTEIIITPSAETVAGMTSDEIRAVTEYQNRTIGIPDVFDGIEDPAWLGYYRPEGDPLTLTEGAALYSGWTADIHRWLVEAIDLRRQFAPGEATDEFDSYAYLERKQAEDALFYLGQRALHELGAKGWLYR